MALQKVVDISQTVQNKMHFQSEIDTGGKARKPDSVCCQVAHDEI